MSRQSYIGVMPSDPEERVPMTFAERNTWLYAFLIPITTLAYFAVVIPRVLKQPAAEVSWVSPMLWAIGASIGGSILGSIILAIVGTIITRDAKTHEDVRDKQIERYGDRLAQAITAFGAAGVLVLAMVKADHFWIASFIFLIGAIGATLGSIAKIRAYRGGFHG